MYKGFFKFIYAFLDIGEYVFLYMQICTGKSLFYKRI